jgi:hypothetical protein
MSIAKGKLSALFMCLVVLSGLNHVGTKIPIFGSSHFLQSSFHIQPSKCMGQIYSSTLLHDSFQRDISRRKEYLARTNCRKNI